MTARVWRDRMSCHERAKPVILAASTVSACDTPFACRFLAGQATSGVMVLSSPSHERLRYLQSDCAGSSSALVETLFRRPIAGPLRIPPATGLSRRFAHLLSRTALLSLHRSLRLCRSPRAVGTLRLGCGRNMGIFSFAAAARAGLSGRVLCLEPDLWSVRLLSRSCDYNRGRAAPCTCCLLLSATAWRWSGSMCRSAVAPLPIFIEQAVRAPTSRVGCANRSGPDRHARLLAQHFAAPQVIKIDVTARNAACSKAARTPPEPPAGRPHEVHERNADAVSGYLHELGYTLLISLVARAARRRSLAPPTTRSRFLPKMRITIAMGFFLPMPRLRVAPWRRLGSGSVRNSCGRTFRGSRVTTLAGISARKLVKAWR